MIPTINRQSKQPLYGSSKQRLELQSKSLGKAFIKAIKVAAACEHVILWKVNFHQLGWYGSISLYSDCIMRWPEKRSLQECTAQRIQSDDGLYLFTVTSIQTEQ